MSGRNINIIKAISAALFVLQCHFFLNAQDTIFVEFNKTTKGCPMQGPMKLDSYNYSRGYHYPIITYSCGNIPELILDTLPNYEKKFTGIVIAKWYWRSDNSDSLFMKQLVEVSNGEVKFKKNFFYQKHYLLSETIENDSIRQHTVYQPNGAIERKEIWSLLNNEQIVFNGDIIPKDIFHYDTNGKLSVHEFYLDGSIYNDMYQHEETYVIHLRLKGDTLIDVLNTNCQFVDRNGKIIAKSDFLEGIKSGEIESWECNVFVEDDKPACTDFIIRDGLFDIFNETKFDRLKKRLNEKCKGTNTLN